jgi:hypothetical protein
MLETIVGRERERLHHEYDQLVEAYVQAGIPLSTLQSSTNKLIYTTIKKWDADKEQHCQSSVLQPQRAVIITEALDRRIRKQLLPQQVQTALTNEYHRITRSLYYEARIKVYQVRDQSTNGTRRAHDDQPELRPPRVYDTPVVRNETQYLQ